MAAPGGDARQGGPRRGAAVVAVLFRKTMVACNELLAGPRRASQGWGCGDADSAIGSQVRLLTVSSGFRTRLCGVSCHLRRVYGVVRAFILESYSGCSSRRMSQGGVELPRKDQGSGRGAFWADTGRLLGHSGLGVV